MRALSATRGSCLALAAAGLLLTCRQVPTSPSWHSHLPAAVEEFGIVGPPLVVLGETARFSLFERLPNGSRRDVAADATWAIEHGQVASIAGPGLVTGRAGGETNIEARFGARSFSKPVMVLPAGTHRLSGRVNIADLPLWPIAGARVEVTTGIAAGLFTFTDGQGAYRLYGVSGETGIRAASEGYQPIERTIVVADHRSEDIELPPLEPRGALTGSYAMTFTAADECGMGNGDQKVTAEARVKELRAAVKQSGSELVIRLTGATFIRDTRTVVQIDVSGRAGPEGVTFDLTQNSELQPPIVVYIPGGGVLVLEGTVAASGPAHRLSGFFSGRFVVYPADDVGDPIARCSSARHAFLLSR